MQQTTSQQISLRSILMLSSHIFLDPIDGVFPRGAPLYVPALLVSSSCVHFHPFIVSMIPFLLFVPLLKKQGTILRG